MENFDEKDYALSINEYSMILQNNSRNKTEKDFIRYQKELQKAIGINQSLNNKKSAHTRIKCEFLGESGWVICPYWHPRKDETWYDTWFWMAYNGKEEKIADYFIEHEYSLLKSINGYTRFEVSRVDWFLESEYLFKKHYYTSCAMLLTAILEESIRKCPIESWLFKVTKFYKNAVHDKVEEYYSINNKPINKYIETLLILPSIDRFISTYFDSGYQFGKNKQNKNKEEPPFLERNWLMHGLTKRKVDESDCIKLYNAISSLHYIMQTLFKEGKG